MTIFQGITMNRKWSIVALFKNTELPYNCRKNGPHNLFAAFKGTVHPKITISIHQNLSASHYDFFFSAEH